MTREGGTKSSFSPLRMFLRATRPRSPMSTRWMARRCSGRPESMSHRSSDAALSRDSISQPHGTPAATSRWAGTDADAAEARTGAWPRVRESEEYECGSGRRWRGARSGGRNCGWSAVVEVAMAKLMWSVCRRRRGGLSATASPQGSWRAWHLYSWIFHAGLPRSVIYVQFLKKKKSVSYSLVG